MRRESVEMTSTQSSIVFIEDIDHTDYLLVAQVLSVCTSRVANLWIASL